MRKIIVLSKKSAKNLSIQFVCATILTGCVGATIPEKLEAINPQNQIDVSTSDWSKVPAVTRHYIAKPAFILKPEDLPEKKSGMVISIDFNSMASLRDVMAVLGDQGLPSIITNDEIASKSISINKFTGSVGQLLNAIALSMDVAFNWKNGVLLVNKTSDYMLSMTQDAEMLNKVQAEISKLGAVNVSTSIPAGTISFSSSDRSRFAIEQYMNRIIKNAATINLQIAVISVTLDNNRTTGIDWSNLSATFRGGIPKPVDTNAMLTTPVVGSPNSDSATDITTQVVKAGVKAALDSTGLGLALDGGDFSMKVLLSALSKYGNTKTDQNLLLKTLSGNKVKIKSGSTVPYVSGVSTTFAGGGSGNLSNGVMGGANTDKAESGITVDVTPIYDADTNVVTLNVDLKLSAITGFVDLKAGAQLGTLTQPSTQDQSFNDVAKLQAGDTILLGGLILEHNEDRRNSLVPLESLPVGQANVTARREALFIVIRPTSDVYEFSDTQSDNASFKVNKSNDKASITSLPAKAKI